MIYYYIVDNDNKKDKVSIKIGSNILPFVKVGDEITVSYYKEQDVIEIASIK